MLGPVANKQRPEKSTGHERRHCRFRDGRAINIEVAAAAIGPNHEVAVDVGPKLVARCVADQKWLRVRDACTPEVAVAAAAGRYDAIYDQIATDGHRRHRGRWNCKRLIGQKITNPDATPALINDNTIVDFDVPTC